MRDFTFDSGRGTHRLGVAAIVVALVAGAAFIISADVAGGRPFSPAGTARAFADLASRMLVEGESPSRSVVSETAVRALQTLGVSIAAAGMASVVAAATLGFATDRRRRGVRRPLALIIRWSYVLARSVPELVWALVVVFVIRPGSLAAAVALAIHNTGVIGRLGIDVIENLDPAAEEAVRSSGAGTSLAMVTAVIPQALPQILTFVLYRWEVIIRTTVVVGFVAGSGLGSQFRLAVSFFRWRELGLIITAYVVLVLLVDGISAILRRLAR